MRHRPSSILRAPPHEQLTAQDVGERLRGVCTTCFERCKAETEPLVAVSSGVSRMRQAYELAIYSYKEAAHTDPNSRS